MKSVWKWAKGMIIILGIAATIIALGYLFNKNGVSAYIMGKSISQPVFSCGAVSDFIFKDYACYALAGFLTITLSLLYVAVILLTIVGAVYAVIKFPIAVGEFFTSRRKAKGQ